MDRSFKVNEKERLVVFKDGLRETFREITSVDAKGGEWLRLISSEGYVLINPNNVNYMIVPIEAKVR